MTPEPTLTASYSTSFDDLSIFIKKIHLFGFIFHNVMMLSLLSHPDYIPITVFIFKLHLSHCSIELRIIWCMFFFAAIGGPAFGSDKLSEVDTYMYSPKLLPAFLPWLIHVQSTITPCLWSPNDFRSILYGWPGDDPPGLILVKPSPGMTLCARWQLRVGRIPRPLIT